MESLFTHKQRQLGEQLRLCRVVQEVVGTVFSAIDTCNVVAVVTRCPKHAESHQ